MQYIPGVTPAQSASGAESQRVVPYSFNAIQSGCHARTICIGCIVSTDGSKAAVGSPLGFTIRTRRYDPEMAAWWFCWRNMLLFGCFVAVLLCCSEAFFCFRCVVVGLHDPHEAARP